MGSAVATGLTNIGTSTTPVSLTFGFDPTVTGCGLVVTWSGRTSNGLARGNIQAGHGIAGYRAGAAAGVISVAGSSVNTGTSACASGQRDDVIIHALDTAGADAGEATLAWTSTGATLTPVTGHTFTNNLVIHWWAVPIGALATFTANEPATATTSQTTGLPAPPICGIVPIMGNVSSFASPSQTATDFNLSFGFFLKNQAGTIRNGVTAAWSDSGQATTVSKTYCNFSECMARGDSTAGNTPRARAACSAMGSADFTWNYASVEGSGTHAYPVLLFFDGQWEANQITMVTNTTTDIVITPGFQALGTLVMTTGNTGFNTLGTASGSGRQCIGMAAGTATQHGSATRDTNGQVGAVCTIGSDNANCIYAVTNAGPAIESAGHITAVGATTTTFRMTTAPASALVAIAVSVGIVDATGLSATSAAGTTVPSVSVGLTSGAATPAAGAPTPAVSVGLTGASVTVAGGTLTPGSGGSDVTVGATGSTSTGALGTLGPAVSVPLLGVSATTTSTGLSLLVSILMSGGAVSGLGGVFAPTVTIPLSGQLQTTALGSPAPALSAPLPGLAATAGLGVTAPSASVGVLGQGLTSSLGTMPLSIATALAGLAATGQQGGLSPPGINLAGLQVSLVQGILTPSISAGLVGQQMTGQEGDLADPGGIQMVGQQATIVPGGLGVSIAAAIAGGPLAASGGSAAPSTDAPLPGLAATAQGGSQAPSASVGLVGQSMTGQKGGITPPGVLAGLQFSVLAGTVTPSVSAAVAGQAASVSPGALTPSPAVTLASLLSTVTGGAALPSVVAALLGLPVSPALGSPTPDASVGLAGQQLAPSPGLLSAGTSLVLQASAVQTFVGALSPSGGISPLPPPPPPTSESLKRLEDATTQIIEASTQCVHGIFQSDVIVLSALRAAFADLRAHPELLESVFCTLGEDKLTSRTYGDAERSRAVEWFLNTNVPVVMDFRIDLNEGTCVSVSLLSSEEVESTLSDVHYDVDEMVESPWPSTAPFSASYDPDTGAVRIPTWVGDQFTIVPGAVVSDTAGRNYAVLSVEGPRDFTIRPGLVVDLRRATMRYGNPGLVQSLESTRVREVYRIGCHAHGDPVLLTYLHSIVVFCLLRYKQDLIEARGLERTSLSSGPFIADNGMGSERLWTRYVNMTGYAQQVWPKAPTQPTRRVLVGADPGLVFTHSVDGDVNEDPSLEGWGIRTRR